MGFHRNISTTYGTTDWGLKSWATTLKQTTYISEGSMSFFFCFVWDADNFSQFISSARQTDGKAENWTQQQVKNWLLHKLINVEIRSVFLVSYKIERALRDFEAKLLDVYCPCIFLVSSTDILLPTLDFCCILPLIFVLCYHTNSLIRAN